MSDVGHERTDQIPSDNLQIRRDSIQSVVSVESDLDTLQTGTRSTDTTIQSYATAQTNTIPIQDSSVQYETDIDIAVTQDSGVHYESNVEVINTTVVNTVEENEVIGYVETNEKPEVRCDPEVRSTLEFEETSGVFEVEILVENKVIVDESILDEINTKDCVDKFKPVQMARGRQMIYLRSKNTFFFVKF